MAATSGAMIVAALSELQHVSAAPGVTLDRPPISVVFAADAYLLREAVKHLLEGTPGVTVVGECDDAHTVASGIDKERAYAAAGHVSRWVTAALVYLNDRPEPPKQSGRCCRWPGCAERSRRGTRRQPPAVTSAP